MNLHVHNTHRSGWVRACVLGANDGILSISSLILGIASAHASQENILIAGIAGLVGGSLSMGAGEYVSVSSQADIERADIEIEKLSLQTDYAFEHKELTEIYVQRGLDIHLAEQVAQQLMAHDALAAHTRDDIGITTELSARPFLAAWTSSVSFAVGGFMPLAAALLVQSTAQIPVIAISSLIFLFMLGAFAARTGGASVLVGAGRVLLWGILVMGITSTVGAWLGTKNV